MRVLSLGVIVAALLASSAPRAEASLTRNESAALLAEASEHFRKGIASMESNREESGAEFDAAINNFERVARDTGLRNGKLFYNIGSAHLMQGDLGRAILNFKRADRLISGDANLVANLAYARQRVANTIDAPGEERVRRALLFWHDETPPAARFTVFLGAYALAWGWALLRLAKPRLVGGWWPVAACALVAAACLTSLVIQRRVALADSEAVVVAVQTIGRKGPDASAYEPSFTEPLHSGVEIIVVERRPGWVLARLGDGRTTWLEDSAVEGVGPT